MRVPRAVEAAMERAVATSAERGRSTRAAMSQEPPTSTCFGAWPEVKRVSWMLPRSNRAKRYHWSGHDRRTRRLTVTRLHP